jgi:small-conductance mechanosensitive channel
MKIVSAKIASVLEAFLLAIGSRLLAAVAGLVAATGAASAQTVEEQATGLVAAILHIAKHRLSGLATDLVEAPAEIIQLWTGTGSAMATGPGVMTLTYGLVLVIIGAGAEWLYWTYASPVVRAVEAAPVATPRQAFRLAMQRLALMTFGLLLFAFSIVGAAAYFDWPSGFDGFVIATILMIVVIRVAWLLAEVIAAPGHPKLRLGAIEPRQASAFVAVVVGMAFLLGLGRFVPDLLESTGGAPHTASVLRILVATLTAGIVLMGVLATVRRNRRTATSPRFLPPRFPVAFLLAVLILGIYGIWLAFGTTAAALLAAIAIVIAIETQLRAWVLFFWSDQIDPAIRANESGDTTGAGLLPNIVLSLTRYVVVMLGIGAVMLVLGMPLAGMMTGENAITRFVLHLLGVAGLALATNIGWIAVRETIDRRLRSLGAVDVHGEPSPNARLLTLLPLLRMTSAIVFLVLLVLSALWTLGIEITPLLAGAGVFGLALGFGAQALVRDVIAGIFYLVEDVFRVGEYIESGATTKGTVERITLRTVALRHHNGPLHFVPYGSLGTVRNNSRDWVIEKFNLPLPVNVDSEQVRKIVKKVGESMLADPEIGPLMREPLKAKLYRIDPGVKIFRCKFQTAPGKQFDVRAQAYRRIETALREAGIHFADGAQTVVLPPAPAQGLAVPA